MKKAIIFGINGQDGFYLKNKLLYEKIEVIGVSRSNATIIGSVNDARLVKTLIKENKPDYIFHLAAVSQTSHELLLEHQETILKGTLNILENSWIHSPASKIFISGSGLQFINTGKPISEFDPFEAKDSYSLARIQSAYATRYYKNKGLNTYIGYFFNHDSPLRSEKHLNQFIVQTAMRLENKIDKRLTIRDPQYMKEFLFAGDAMDAVLTFVNQNDISEVVIGSGLAYKVLDWIKICFDYFNLELENYLESENIESNPNILVSDPKTIFSLGWRPKVNIEELALLMINHDPQFIRT
ncbi:MAG: GDP-mannose 4,6-dehydratase [Saprospiraceae bacterium]